jgi:hypothetical protein
MARFSLKLTERANEAAKPANNLALTLAFACVGLLNTALTLTRGGSFDLFRLIF